MGWRSPGRRATLRPVLFQRFLTYFPDVVEQSGYGGFGHFYVGTDRIAETHTYRQNAHIFLDAPGVEAAYQKVMRGPFLS